MADSDETTSTAASSVRFLDEPEVLYPKEEVPAPVPTVVGKQRYRSSRRERREQQKAQEDAKKRYQKNLELFKRFADQLTPQKLAADVKEYVYEDMEELGIKEQINGVPNNGRAPFFPMSYCSNCVDRIAAYFKDENMAKIIDNGVDDDGVKEQVYIKDVKKLAISFLDEQKLHFYDHVTVEAFNLNAMKRGGSMYGVPLSVACIVENGGGSSNLYEKLAGKETLCAAFSTGITMQCGTSELTALSENSFKTHKQLLEENVDLDTIRSSCSCFKSDEWLKERATVEKKMKSLMQKKNNWNNDSGDDSDDDESGEEDSDEEDKHSEEKEKEDEEDSMVEFEQPEDVDDYDFRPRNLIQPVEKEEDFDNERWSDMRTASSCLALCRHAHSCIVNTINKARVLESLTLVRLPKDEKKGIASTTPGEYFTVISQSKSSLIFSLGATVYEALAYQHDDDWNDTSDGEDDLSFIKSSRKTIAKVYTTVHTVAAPFFRSAPVCHIDLQNKYGYYKTFRICIPGNFSGYYNDTSIGWRSELYSRITSSAIEAECRGDKKSHTPFLEKDEEIEAWPRRKPIRVERGIVYDDSGDTSGNYLTCDGFFGIGEKERTAATAYANMRNLTVAFKIIKGSIGELLMGPFKKQQLELKTLDIERTYAEETAGEEGLSVHETQHRNDTRTNMTRKVKFTAQTIERYEKCLNSLERDLGTMNKHLSYNLKGFTAAAASHKPDINDNVYAYYL